MLKNLEKLRFDSLIPCKKNIEFTNIPSQYDCFLGYTDGGRVENATILIDLQTEVIIEYLDVFMSFEQLISNEYLLGYLNYLESDEYLMCRNIIDTYKVFCSTMSPNTFFAFRIKEETENDVYFLDFNEYPFEVYHVFQDFQTFMDKISVK
ncbi:SMI1/KNR4 family protein [Runella zeae]|uniref:SMI1/KNR4 family protein n=1 Tax=Runella zeae TaxID=94255 RepID=UPI002355D7AE|nr:SMI1/KNR4 family protein [Runella zeae]